VRADRGHRGTAPLEQLGVRAGLDRPDRQPAHRPAGRTVAEPGDLRLVTHQPDEREAAPGGDGRGQRARRRGTVHRRAAHADVHPTRLPGAVQVDAHPDRWAAAGRHDVVHEIELLHGVHHDRDRGARGRIGREPRDGRAVRGRVTHHRVRGDPVADQPQRLRQGVREDAAPAGPGEHPAQRGAAAHRLARDPQRLAGGVGGHRVGIGVERGDVDDRDRTGQRCRREIEPLHGRGGDHPCTVTPHEWSEMRPSRR
jgi:hypothetical protein